MLGYIIIRMNLEFFVSCKCIENSYMQSEETHLRKLSDFNGLILVAESKERFLDKMLGWKKCLNCKVFRMISGKAKGMQHRSFKFIDKLAPYLCENSLVVWVVFIEDALKLDFHDNVEVNWSDVVKKNKSYAFK